MRTRGWVIVGVAVVIAVAGTWGVHRVVEQAHIGTAYVAKLTCSCLFVSHRSPQSCATDYDAAAVRPLTREVAGQSVTVSALGHVIAARAVFEPGFGCHLVSVTHAALVPLPPQSAQVPWPQADWPTGPLPPQVEAAAFHRAMQDAFGRTVAHLGETREVVVIQGGRLVYEQYASGYSRDMRIVSWSMAKSVTQALVGTAVLQGLINIDRPMGNPHWAPDDSRARIPWRTWLQMTDGQRYLEIGAPSIETSDAAKKLFGPGRLDVAGYCAGLPLAHEPGSVWNYNSCGFVLVTDALSRAVVPHPASPQARREAMLKWMRASLFDVLGMDVQPEFDATGLFYGSAMIYGTARDFARFGLLYLRDGVWNGHRVLPRGWVDFARTPARGTNADIYGAGWWLNPQTGRGRPLPVLIDTGPERDAFRAQGFQGQVILVVPSKDLVIVRMGFTPEADPGWAAVGDWLGRVARTFPVVVGREVSARASR